MTQYVAFLRAINVGGHAIVKMTDLRDAFVAAGCGDVRTFIASGNVVFASAGKGTAALFQRIRSRLRTLLGAEPQVLFRTVRALERLVKAAPFKRFEAERDAKLYVTFLARKAKSIPKLPLRSSKEALEVFALEGLEVFLVSRRKKNGFYGFPNELTERTLGVPTTSRNWSTVTKIVEFAKKGSAG